MTEVKVPVGKHVYVQINYIDDDKFSNFFSKSI